MKTFPSFKQHHDITVLYVEEDEQIQQETLKLLFQCFSSITTAKSGKEALLKYQAYHQRHQKYYDIVLTDIKLAEMNQFELIESIQKLQPRQDFIVLSAHNETEYLIELIDLEVTHFILKPIDIQRFQKVFSHVIEIVLQKRAFQAMNKELREAKRIAEAESQHKSQFLANMSHEIRTPLNAITGFITLLEEMEDDPKKLKYLQIIKNSSDSLVQIINDILDISKIESGKLLIEPTHFNLYENLITIAELFQAKAAQKGINFQIKYNQNIPEYLYGDALRIKQIFTNLLSNAIKFTPEGSSVKCIIWYKHETLHISVKDYGIGISKEKQESIFEAFTQADSSTERVYGGTGLGLTISLELARLLGGNLTLKSKEGKGSTFTLSVPMPIGKKESLTPTSEESLLQGEVLIVEDYEANRMLLGILLENAGLSYTMAEDGLEALKAFKEKRFDLILMDENMPNLGGTDTVKEIRKIEQQDALTPTPIISLTANALHGDKERFLQSGFDDYLSKPINPKALRHTLEQFLSQHPKKSLPTTKEPKQTIPSQRVIITQVLEEAREYFEAFGFEEAQLNELLDSAKSDLTSTLESLYQALHTTPPSREELNALLHALKGLFLNLGAMGLGEQMREIEQEELLERISSLKKLLFPS